MKSIENLRNGGAQMNRSKRNWHPDFIKYMNLIIHHPNYAGLPIEKKSDGSYRWITTAKSEIGRGRIDWCLNKAKELGIPNKAGVYADVMLAIHPTKIKVCQTCGRKMSLYYLYPNTNFLKSLNKCFNSNFTECDNICDIWDALATNGKKEKEMSLFLIKKGDLPLSSDSATKMEIINALEYACRKGGKKCLGPGAMSNFPDRFDGFHTYNRCCRSAQDKGRSKENLKSYTKDRRAYEYWSDGNIHAANLFMGTAFFKGTSADHIGPISLGFIHDPRYLQPMLSGDNSSKRDRLSVNDIEKILAIEERTGVYPMSWYSSLIWNYISRNYKSNPDKVSNEYRNALKQNMTNFMFILWYIMTHCSTKGESLLVSAFLEPKFKYFDHAYKFNSLGEIVKTFPRHHTGRTMGETSRYIRIAIASVYDYFEKVNRNQSPDLTTGEISTLNEICNQIITAQPTEYIKNNIVSLVETIEQRLIHQL